MTAPDFVTKFAVLLVKHAPTTITVPVGSDRVTGRRGIRRESRIQYNHRASNQLGRNLEYTFRLPSGGEVEVSLQLYLNVDDHWRLFAYCKEGMLLSVNLTVLRKNGPEFDISQTLRIAAVSSSPQQRQADRDGLCRVLSSLGFEIDAASRLLLARYDSQVGRFVTSSPYEFLRAFLTAALVKGHFMRNKGYELPLDRAVSSDGGMASPKPPTDRKTESKQLTDARLGQPVSRATPRVGIFFVVDGHLLIDAVPLVQGEPYGDAVGNGGHHDYWKTLTPKKTVEKRFKERAYDTYPRGRVVFFTESKRFVIYTDKCLTAGMLRRVATQFGISKPVFASDEHYQCAKCNPSFLD